MVDALQGAGTGGCGLADQVEASVTVEAQGTAQFCTSLAVQRAIDRRIWRTAVCRCGKKKAYVVYLKLLGTFTKTVTF